MPGNSNAGQKRRGKTPPKNMALLAGRFAPELLHSAYSQPIEQRPSRKHSFRPTVTLADDHRELLQVYSKVLDSSEGDVLALCWSTFCRALETGLDGDGKPIRWHAEPLPPSVVRALQSNASKLRKKRHRGPEPDILEHWQSAPE